MFIGAAVMPVSPATEGFGPYRIDVGNNDCGPAIGVVVGHTANSDCRIAAHKRLLAAGASGLVVVALGMALYAGPEERRGTRVRVGTPRVRRSILRSRDSRRYTPS